jgi:hypothetical protein
MAGADLLTNHKLFYYFKGNTIFLVVNRIINEIILLFFARILHWLRAHMSMFRIAEQTDRLVLASQRGDLGSIPGRDLSLSVPLV